MPTECKGIAPPPKKRRGYGRKISQVAYLIGGGLLRSLLNLLIRKTRRVEPSIDGYKASRSSAGWRQASQNLIDLLAPDPDRKGPLMMISGNGAPGGGSRFHVFGAVAFSNPIGASGIIAGSN